MASSPEVNPIKDATPVKPSKSAEPAAIKKALGSIYSNSGSSELTMTPMQAITPTFSSSLLPNPTETNDEISKKHPLKGLSDPRIEKVPNIKEASNLETRPAGSVTNIKIELGKNPKEPPNYVIEANGKIKELRPPNKALNNQDNSIIIQVEPQPDGKLANNQASEIKQLVACVQKDYQNAITSENLAKPIQEALTDNVAPIKMPAPIPVEERGGKIHATEAGGVKQWGGGGGTLGGNGTFFNPGDIPNSYQADGGAGTYHAPYDFSKVPGGPLDLTNPVDKVAALISSNEGNPTSINWNDNGAGVSVGMFQANQKVGELPMLFQQLADTPQGYALLVEIFGPKLAAEIKADPNLIRKLDFTPNNELGKDLEKLVQSPIFQGLELKILRQKVETASQVAKTVGVTSTEGVALVADMINQFGESGASSFIHAATGSSGQEQKITAMVDAVVHGSKYGARYVADVKKASKFDLSASQTFQSNGSKIENA